jgi:hypothetical protein
MGLDMYVTRKSYVKNWEHRETKHKINITLDGVERTDINPNRVSYIEEEAGYWRKANHIHKWFVDNVQDGEDNCQESYVSIEQFEELKSICEQVILKKDIEFNNEVLPTTSGFFFGGTEYDEYYYEQCQETIDIINEILEIEKKTPDGCSSSYYYQSSW